MKTINLYRLSTDDQGTAGVLITNGFLCRTLELPWLDNKPNVSCIPTGVYKCKRYKSRRFGDTFIVTAVDGRTYILFHGGNLAGNKELGFKTHSAGCILLGKFTGTLHGQKAVLISRNTVHAFQLHLRNTKEFELTIEEVY